MLEGSSDLRSRVESTTVRRPRTAAREKKPDPRGQGKVSPRGIVGQTGDMMRALPGLTILAFSLFGCADGDDGAERSGFSDQSSDHLGAADAAEPASVHPRDPAPAGRREGRVLGALVRSGDSAELSFGGRSVTVEVDGSLDPEAVAAIIAAEEELGEFLEIEIAATPGLSVGPLVRLLEEHGKVPIIVSPSPKNVGAPRD